MEVVCNLEEEVRAILDPGEAKVRRCRRSCGGVSWRGCGQVSAAPLVRGPGVNRTHWTPVQGVKARCEAPPSPNTSHWSQPAGGLKIVRCEEV